LWGVSTVKVAVVGRCVVGCEHCEGLCSVIVRGAFAKLRKATISFVMSVRPHGTTRLPLDGFTWNLIFDYFFKNCRENSSFIYIGQEWRHFTCRPIYIFYHLAQFFLERKIFQTKVVEKIKTITVFRKSCYNEIMWRNTVERGRPQMTIWRITCWIPKASQNM